VKRHKRTLVIATVVVLLAAPTATIAWATRSNGDAATDATDATDSTTDATTGATPGSETAEVVTGDLTTESDYTAQIGYGDAWSLPLQPGGVITASQPEGTVVDFGDELVRIDNAPVILVEGGFPLYRELALTSPLQIGYDVLQLQHFLLAAGFDDDGDLAADGEFGTSTRNAVRDWQESLGVAETGRVDASQVLFSATPLRLASTARVGTAFDGLQVTDVDPIVTVDSSADDLVGLPVDGDVTVELADGTTYHGTVSHRERVVGSDGTASWRSTITMDGGFAGDLDGTESSVLVHSTIVEASDVLIVPVSALLAVAEGGFAVEVIDPSGTHLVRVDVGTVVDARAEISGDIDAGAHVVVPS